MNKFELELGVEDYEKEWKQGPAFPAFHALLWSINELIHREHFHERCKSLITGQIHDALFMDVVPSEFMKIQKLVTEIMTVRVREANLWIITPLEAEWSCSEVNGSWTEMTDIEE